MNLILILYALCFFQAPDKTYPVNHTLQEWGRAESGLYGIQQLTRYTALPAETRYYIDSVIQQHISDIDKQVLAAREAEAAMKQKVDSLLKNKKP